MTQDELDALLMQQGDEEAVSPSPLDDLLEPDSPDEATPVEASAMDDLLHGPESEDAPPTPPEPPAPQESEPESLDPAGEMDDELDTAALDARLMASAPESSDDPAADAPEPGTGDKDHESELDTAALDALFAETSAETVDDAAGLDETIGDSAPDAPIDPADQEGLDALLTGTGAVDDAPVDTTPRDAVADHEDEVIPPPSESLEAGGDTLDEPMDEPAAPAEAVGAENQAAAAGSDPGELLDEAAFGALVEQAVEEAGAGGGEAENAGDEDLIEAPAFEPDSERAEQEQSQTRDAAEGEGVEGGEGSEPPMDPDIAAAIDLEALVVDDADQPAPDASEAAGAPTGGGTGGEEAVEAAAVKPRRGRVKLPSIRIVLPAISMTGMMAALQQHAIRIATATSAGMVVSMATFTFLVTNPVQQPEPIELAALRAPTLDEAITQARAAMRAEQYAEAAATLELAMGRTPESPLMADAHYLRIEAAYRAMGDYASERERMAFHGEVADFELNYPEDPRTARTLAWQAEQYEREGHPYDALRNYRKIIANYPNHDDMPGVLLASARLALATNQPDDALAALENLMRTYPGAPSASEARLLLAQTYAAQGDRRRARELLEGVARTQSHTALGASATAQLARLAFEEGRYEDAIEMLESRRRRATTVDGNDEVYLLLAQAYRDAGQPAEAERVLRELIDFFPDTPLMPQAYLALSNLLERDGRREEALRLANLALERFDDDPAVMRNAAELLERAGQPLEAADLYMRAEAIDQGDPTLRLRAGRAYLEAGDAGRARDTLEAIANAFPGTPEAISAGIEWARATHRAGDPDRAMDRLRALRDQTLGQPAQVPVLLAMAEIYHDLGLRGPLAEIQREVASLTNEPQRIAQAAIDMLDAGLVDPGLAAAQRVELEAVRPETAYELLTKQGRTLLQSDSGRAIALLERAIDEYASYRTPAGDRALFRAYLATNQSAQARIMLTELEQLARRDPLLHEHALDMAAKFGDYHYERGDYRAALDAYGKVLDAPYAEGVHHDWAAFQRANALVHIREYDDAIDAYEALIAEGNDWANEAQLRMGLVQIERRMRTGRPTEAAAR